MWYRPRKDSLAFGADPEINIFVNVSRNNVEILKNKS